jgi:hypothetical protein
MIGGGALGQPAATAVRHVSAQNGVWSLGNFGGVPPKSAMMYHGTNPVPGEELSDAGVKKQAQQPAKDGAVLANKIEDPDYRFVFNSCTVGMVGEIAELTNIFLHDIESNFDSISSFFFRLLHQWEEHLLIATSFSANLRTSPSRKFAL